MLSTAIAGARGCLAPCGGPLAQRQVPVAGPCMQRPRQHSRRLNVASRPLTASAFGSRSQDSADAEPDLHGALSSVGERFSEAAQQLRSTFSGSTDASARECRQRSRKQQRRQQRRPRGQQADKASDNGLVAAAQSTVEAGKAGAEVGFERAKQDLGKAMQLAKRHRAAKKLRRSDSDSSAVRSVRAAAAAKGSSGSGGSSGSSSPGGLAPSVFGRWRSGSNQHGSGNGSEAAEHAQRSLDEADGVVARVQQGASKVTRSTLFPPTDEPVHAAMAVTDDTNTTFVTHSLLCMQGCVHARLAFCQIAKM